MSIEQIRTTAEVSRNTAKKYLAVLVKDGIAGVDDSGRYPKFFATGATPDDSQAKQSKAMAQAEVNHQREEYRRHQAESLHHALTNRDFHRPEIPRWKQEFFQGPIGYYRLNSDGLEAVLKQGWTWPHWKVPVEFREYLSKSLEPPHGNVALNGRTPWSYGPRPAEDLIGFDDPRDLFQPRRIPAPGYVYPCVDSAFEFRSWKGYPEPRYSFRSRGEQFEIEEWDTSLPWAPFNPNGMPINPLTGEILGRNKSVIKDPFQESYPES